MALFIVVSDRDQDSQKFIAQKYSAFRSCFRGQLKRIHNSGAMQ